MLTGKVKWFNNAKGYGFILPDTGGEDLFVHYSSIQMPGYKTLKAGQLVSFETTPGQKGLHAVNIHALEDADNPGLNDQDRLAEQVLGRQNVDTTSSALLAKQLKEAESN